MKKLRIFESESESLDWFLSTYGDYSLFRRHAFYVWISTRHYEGIEEGSEVVDGKIGGYDVRDLMVKFNQSYAGVVESTNIDMKNPNTDFYSTLENIPIFRKMVDESNYSREDIGDYFYNSLFDFVESEFDGERVIYVFCKIDFSKNMKELFDEITSAMEGKYPQQSQKGSYRYR